MGAVRVLLLMLLLAGCHEDACEKALARIARIDGKRGLRKPTADAANEMLAQCRKRGTASYDPVVRCAMDSKTDDDAAACIDAFLKAVLKATPAKPGDPKGLNPLLQSTP